jgi:hypothetical protein
MSLLSSFLCFENFLSDPFSSIFPLTQKCLICIFGRLLACGENGVKKLY